MTIDVMKSVELTRREQIIAVAARIFKDNGYAGASMRTIADAVGIEASSLYNHIHSKQDILATICFNIGNDYVQGLDSLLSAPLSCHHKIEQIIHLHIDLASKYKDNMQVFEEEWKHLKGKESKEFRSMRAYYEHQLSNFFKESIEQGVLYHYNPEIIVFYFLSSLKWLNYYFKENKEQNIEMVKANLVQILSKGLFRETY